MGERQGCRVVRRGPSAPARIRPVLRVAQACPHCVARRTKRREPGAGELEG
ncbi:hypothetical protein [Nocardia grenadensis]|uniref:hypothetical protein n=1 Tax=Nocardia grenadensis TaxID=931537 RepID=UPI003D8B02CE